MKKVFRPIDVANNNAFSKENLDLLFVEEQTRPKLGCHDYLYRICGTDDAVRIRKKDSSEGEDEVFIEDGYFKIRREFAQRVGKLSREFMVPFKVALAVGDKRENYEALKQAIADVDGISISTMRMLHEQDVLKRKEAMKLVLGDKVYESLKIDQMGDLHSQRIALYIWERCMYRINK